MLNIVFIHKKLLNFNIAHADSHDKEVPSLFAFVIFYLMFNEFLSIFIIIYYCSYDPDFHLSE